MANEYTIAIVSRAVGDFETEDRLTQEVQDFAMSLREKYKDSAHVLVKTDFGIDPNKYSGAIFEEPKRHSDAENTIKIG